MFFFSYHTRNVSTWTFYISNVMIDLLMPIRILKIDLNSSNGLLYFDFPTFLNFFLKIQKNKLWLIFRFQIFYKTLGDKIKKGRNYKFILQTVRLSRYRLKLFALFCTFLLCFSLFLNSSLLRNMRYRYAKMS